MKKSKAEGKEARVLALCTAHLLGGDRQNGKPLHLRTSRSPPREVSAAGGNGCDQGPN